MAHDPMMSGRYFPKGSRPDSVISDRSGINAWKRFINLRVGSIVDINPDRYQFKVEWVNGEGYPDWIPMSFPYVGYGSCIGAMPEIGSLVICGYLTSDAAPGAIPRPMCLAFLPIGLQTALEANPLKKYPDSIPTEEDNIVFTRFRKLNGGDLIVASGEGGELFVNADIEIKDKLRDTILIRGSDQSIIATSINNFVFANGVAVRAGKITRNLIPIFDSNGARIPDQLAREISLPGGRDSIHIVPLGAAIDEKSLYYSEYRVDVDDLVDGHLESNDINSQTGLASRDPIVSLSMGNYVGSTNDSNNVGRYGKILRPVFFNKSSDVEGHFSLVECVQNKGLDEVAKLGLAYAIHLLKKDSFLGFDKEGHLYINLNASTPANPLGAGRSMSLLSTGNLKEVWGQTAEDANSWDLFTGGGVKWNLGQHNDKGNNRSLDINTSSSVYMQVNGAETAPNDPDFNTNPSVAETNTTYSKQEVITGNQKISIGGTEKLEVAGNSVLKVAGMRRERIGGSASHEYQSDKTENIAGIYTQIVVKEMQGRFFKRKETVTSGQDLTVFTGDINETIATFGSKKTTIVLGNILDTVASGNKTTTIGIGNYNVTVGVGGIFLTSASGPVSMTALGVFLQGITADIKALKVGIGHPVRGGVVTGLPGIPTHLDYCTGLPLRGSMSVQASI